jgi:dUTP pyrophosphatase
VNSPGLIDAGYRGEIGVILHNTDLTDSFDVNVGDRIAQLMVVPFASVLPVWVDALDDSQRGEGGFGSSGLS